MLIASTQPRGGTWGLALDKKFEQSASIDRVWSASPLSRCSEIAHGVRVVAINGVETWDRDFDGVCALVDEADASTAPLEISVDKVIFVHVYVDVKDGCFR